MTNGDFDNFREDEDESKRSGKDEKKDTKQGKDRKTTERIRRYTRPNRVDSINTLMAENWPKKTEKTWKEKISSESPQTRDPSTQMPAAENGFSAVIVKGDLAKITNEPEPPQTATPTAREAAKDTNGRVKPKMPPIGRSNKIADSSALGQAFSSVLTNAQEDKKGILEKLGLGPVIGKGEEAEIAQYKQGRIKYIRENFVIDSNEGYFYYWVAVVSVAYVYNLVVIIARSVFIDLDGKRLATFWFVCDCFSDSLYLMDMFVRYRTGFLEQGLLVRDTKRIGKLYLLSRQFIIDLVSISPLEILAHFFGRKWTFLRFNRLFKVNRLLKFIEHTETRSSYPNAFRVGNVVWFIAVIIHWNACLYFLISEWIGLGSDGWVYGIQNKQSLPDGIEDSLARRYIYSFYWSTLILTTIGEVPGPVENGEFLFVTLDLMGGVLIFATIVGNVGSMISNMSAGRTDFQNRMDAIKQYMELRRVGKQLEIRVIKWFDYLWANKQSLSDQQVLDVLPSKLQTEIAMHVHFETLRKVRIFQDCEAGLLTELVLKLHLQVFSPGDFVCRKGDIGREMYIVKRGMLQVVADDGVKVFARLQEGSVFGELSILNIQGSKNGNRRTANVRSVGYTDLFVLNKTDLMSALKEYPEARKVLMTKGRELLLKDNLIDENAPAESRSAEEMADDLQNSVRILQTRLARLMAEHTNTETKLKERIDFLEKRLSAYGSDDEEEEDLKNIPDLYDDIIVTEAAVEAEKRKLLHVEDTDSD